MNDAEELARDAAERLPRFRFVVGVVTAVLVLQLIVSAVSGLVARGEADAAVNDMAGYLGDAAVTRTVAFMEPARVGVQQLVELFERGREPRDHATLAKRLYDTMQARDQIDALFVAFPNGDFVHVRRIENGYETRVFNGGTHSTERYLNDRGFVQRAYQVGAVPFFDATRLPWYTDARSATAPVWTDPYPLPTTNMPGVTTASAARNAEGVLQAVVGADVRVDAISAFLDTLPLGERGEAFVMSADGDVVAAPTVYDDAIAAALADGEVTVPGSALGVEVPTGTGDAGGVEVVRGMQGDLMTLSAGFPASSRLPWTLQVRTQASAISPGIHALERTSLWATVIVGALVLVATVLLFQLRRPLGELHQRASTDDLTRLANRYEFRRRGQTLVDDAYERAEPVCVAMFDLDDFKRVNDTEGHAAGDRALRAASDALREATGPDDVVARFGGDEFVVVRAVGDEAVPYVTVERIRDHMERGINRRRRSGEPLGVTAGYALSGSDYRSLRSLAQEADAALVSGKQQAKGQTHGARAAEQKDDKRYPAPRTR